MVRRGCRNFGSVTFFRRLLGHVGASPFRNDARLLAIPARIAREDFGVASANQGNRLLDDRMLRITIDESEESVVLRIEGQLIAPWVAEVEQCWRRAFANVGERSLQIDLSAVNFVDTAGEALLARMYEAGFRLTGTSAASMLQAIQAIGGPGAN